MRPKYIRVRARSANAGSGTVGWSLAGPAPACFLMDEEVMIGVSWHLRARFEVMCGVASPIIVVSRIRESARSESDVRLVAEFQ